MPTADAIRASRIAALVIPAFVACGSPSSLPPQPPPFVEITDESGIDFVHDNGMTGEKYIAEMMGPGGALFDWDDDGDLDVYLPQGRPFHGSPARESDRLFRNDLEIGPDGERRLRFTDVSAEAGLRPSAGYTFGVAVGDYDADGRRDLYITELGGNRLLRNEPDGTFRDVTAETGVADSRWSMPGAFLDYDGDGHLDLYVGNYLDFRVANHKQCVAPSGRMDYCGPLAYAPLPDRLFRNRGDGTFEDATRRAGLSGVRGNALGAIVCDVDLDGRLDLFVANDTGENHLWRNRGDGTFDETALVAGAALNANGEPEGSMGVDAGDIDGDGDEDIFLTHMSMETNTLYRNAGDGRFEDATIGSGLGAESRESTGFGAAWFDWDNDGWLDVAVANGEIRTIEALARAGDPFPLHQPNQLFRNDDGRRFVEVTAAAGPAFAHSEVTRGLAVGDLDNDGGVDLLLVNNHGPARLLHNRAAAGRRWVGVHVVEGRPGRDAIGARVGLQRDDGSWLWRRVRVSGSYLSANDPRIVFGLGPDGRPPRCVRVEWPGGGAEQWRGIPLDGYRTLRRGEGEAVAP